MNIEHLRRSLKVQWLDYYRENRVWLTRLGVWVNCEGNRRPSSSFILATLSVLEPQLTQMLPLVVDLSSNPDRIVIALGLNFNPDEELTAIEQASPEELKLLPSFGVALPRLVQPLEAQSIEAQATEVKPPTQAPKAQPIEAQAPKAQQKERSSDSSSFSQPINKPTQPSQPEPHKAASHSSGLSANLSAKQQDAQSNQPLDSVKSSKSSKPSPDKSSPDKPEISTASPSPAPKPVLLEKPKPPAPSFGEPVVKQRPPMDTAELAQGQQPDRGTTRKRKGDRPAPPDRT
ncbi:MAG: hypothetical protein HY785_01315 [Oscillatoriophycideae cyanobacterium NC_groundwater_1537_Pr4_S-0.65um_50_18]|nr:hypothetical protein [Oscillatoriophycideae cyanobacterium NC_groundwater_1537_Pr4_S-0.65um_50_18]